MSKLDEKARCCGLKPMAYRGKYALGGPHRFCGRCDRAFDLDGAGEQIPNWAWKLIGGEFVCQTSRAEAIKLRESVK